MSGITNRQAICDALMEKAGSDRDIIVLCSDSRGSASMTAFAKEFPEQFVELGIAEQNLVTVAAGLASCGKKTFVFSPASFLSTRSYEQAKVDVAYGGLNVTLVGISGGISYGPMGMTHQSCQDIAAMAALPDMRVYLPSDRFMTGWLIGELLKDDKPAYVRVSRSASRDIYSPEEDFRLDRAKVLREGRDVMIIACGEMVAQALDVAKILKDMGIDAGVMDMYCLKPLDSQAIIEWAGKTRLLITLEEHSPFGGLGSLVAQVTASKRPVRVEQIALPDGHIIAGESAQVFAHYGMDGKGVAERAAKILKEV